MMVHIVYHVLDLKDESDIGEVTDYTGEVSNDCSFPLCNLFFVELN